MKDSVIGFVVEGLANSAGGGELTSLGTTITLDRLKKRGYEAMLELYQKIAPLPKAFGINEPLYTRPVRTVV